MQVADLYEVARDIKSLPARLGLAGHPDLLANGNKKKWGIVKVMNRILYRCDVPGQYQWQGNLMMAIRTTERKCAKQLLTELTTKEQFVSGMKPFAYLPCSSICLLCPRTTGKAFFCLQVPSRSVPDVLQDLPTAMRAVKTSSPQIPLLSDIQQAEAQDFNHGDAAIEDGGNPVAQSF